MEGLSRCGVLEWAMAESVPVRCPACRREHVYAAPSYPCACGAPVAPALDPRARPEPVTHHTWDDGWVTVRCGTCGRTDQWPRPELGCPCGTALRVPVAEGADGPVGRGTDSAPEDRDAGSGDAPETETTAEAEAEAEAAPGADSRDEGNERNEPNPNEPNPNAHDNQAADPDDPEAPGSDNGTGTDHSAPASHGPRPPARIPLPRTTPAPRPAFQPVTIRTARDAVTAAALYLRWLGYQDIRRAEQRPPSGIGLSARGVVAQVDPTVRPASLRDVECLWLTAMTESAGCVYFSLAGYEEEARACADSLGIPLFVLDLTGTPQPVNSLADELIATGA
jgi:hypothetical protein